MSAPQAPLPYGAPAAPPPQPLVHQVPGGQWRWAAYPGQDPNWYFFPDPAPPAAPPAYLDRPGMSGPASRRRPGRIDVWGDFRRRARRLGFLLMTLAMLCFGVVLYDGVRDHDVSSGVALDLTPEEQGPDPGAADPAPDGDGDDGDDGADGAGRADTGAAAAAALTPEEQAVLDEYADTLHDRAQAWADAMVGGDGGAALEYVEPGCRGRVNDDVAGSIESTRDAYAGVRLVVESITVSQVEGKVAYRVEGTPSEAFADIDVPSKDVPELWNLVDGHWYRDVAECRAG